MAGWGRSAWACLALGAAAVLASEPHGPAASASEPVSLPPQVVSFAAAGEAGEESGVRDELERLRSDMDDLRRRNARLCDEVMKTTNATNTRTIYCAVEKASASFMGTFVLSHLTFWLCFCLSILQSTALQRLPLGVDRGRSGHWVVFVEAVVAANICFNEGNLLPMGMPHGLRWWLVYNPICVVTIFCAVQASLRFVFSPAPNDHKGHGRRTSSGSVHDESKYVVPDRYADLTYAFINVGMLFIVQLSLIVFYWVHLHESTGQYLGSLHEVSFLQWMVGCCVICFQGVDDMGRGFDARYWKMVVGSGNGATFMKRVEVQMRQGMCFFVNGFGLAFIRATFAVILATSGPWGFISDCVMVFFVTSLDDFKQDRPSEVNGRYIKLLMGKAKDDSDPEEDASMSTNSDVECAEGTEATLCFKEHKSFCFFSV